METLNMPVYNMGLFGDDSLHFWLDELENVLEKFPLFEFPFKQDFYTLFVIESAEGEIAIDNQKIRLNKAKVIILKPGYIGRIDINKNAKGKMICFTSDFFSLRYNSNILNQFSFLQRDAKPYIEFTSDQKRHWDTISALFETEYRSQNRETNKVLRSYLNILLFELERLYDPLGFVKSRNIKQEKVHQFEDLIDKYYKSKKKPSEYAELLHISPNYLNKICKEETGQTAGDIIRKRITIEAQRLLHYTNDSINQLAYKLGFDNVSYFVTYFKKQTKTTPEQFRQMYH